MEIFLAACCGAMIGFFFGMYISSYAFYSLLRDYNIMLVIPSADVLLNNLYDEGR